MRFFRYCKSYGAVRCGFEKYEILRCGSVLWYIVRCGPAWFPVERVFLRCGCGSTLRKENSTLHRFFSTLHRMNKPYKTAVSYGSRAFSRARTKALFFCCFSTVYRINKPYKPAGAYGFLSFFYLQAKSSATTGRRRVKNRLNKSIRTYRSSVKNKYQVKIT